MSGKETTQAWYWNYLIKHPDWYSKVREVKERGRHGDKPKVYCRAHLEADIRVEWEKDHDLGAEARTDEDISRVLWSKSHALKQGWMIGNTVTMMNHLKICPLVPQSVRDKALNNPSNAGTGFSSPSKRGGGRLAGPYPTSAHDSRVEGASPTLHLDTGSSSSLPSAGLYNVFGGSDNFTLPEDSHHGLHRSSSVVSLAPSDSISAVASQMSASFSPRPWDASKQALFEEKVLRLTVSANLPFSWVENPEWAEFFGDYFKANTAYMVFVDKAVELITWLRSKTLVLALIREAQEGLGERASAIIHAVITHWTAHYQAFQQLQQVQSALTAVIEKEMKLPPKERNFVRGDRKAKEKCLAMVGIVKDPFFWRAISRMVRHLNPLAIACNVVQAAFCSLDTVLLAFGLLYVKYKILLHEDDSGLHTDEEDSGVRAVLNSLEKRWKKAGQEQEVFIAAVLLNPFFKNSPFSLIPILNRAGIDLTLERLWTRFFQQPAPSDLRKNSREYFDGTGFFAGLQRHCESEIERRRVDQNIVLDPLEALDQYNQAMALPPRSSAQLPRPPRSDDEDNGTQIPPAAPTATTKTAFRKFIEECQELAVEDDHTADYDDMELEVPLTHHLAFNPVLLSELFDYRNKHWANRFETSRGMSLDEEMELYELLDFDADGEAEEDAVDVDDITESILVE
ncbi:hypothetical protein C8R44DRAFT_866446 [Mycena epipterygia]|nr:hypothetical protein C8R44DRAFT_866446 [Mycena epipterygia]